jgi:hypothetical protein
MERMNVSRPFDGRSALALIGSKCESSPYLSGKLSSNNNFSDICRGVLQCRRLPYLD